MRELSQWVFEATEGEEVSLQVKSVGFEGNFVGVGLDEQTLRALNAPDNSLHFRASKPPGLSHLLMFEFNFPSGAPDDACYEVNLTGSQGGGFRRFIYKRDTNHDRDIVVTISETDKAGLQEVPQPQEQPYEEATAKNEDVVAILLKRDTAVDLLNAIVTNLGVVSLGGVGGKRGSPNLEETMEWSRDDDDSVHQEGDLEDADLSIDIPTHPPLPENYKRSRPPARSTEPAENKTANPGPASSKTGVAPNKIVSPSRSKPRYVNVGFAAEQTPTKQIKKDSPLACDQPYYFFLEVGRLLKGNIDTKAEVLTKEQAPPGAVLKVVLFPFKQELQIKRRAEIGELKVLPDLSVIVEQPVARPAELKPGSTLLKRRLFFPVRTPKRAGVFRLRCNIYHKQILVQSRLIQAQVMPQPRLTKGALRSIVDYRLARTFSTSHLAGLEPHRLSVMLNDNGDGTHGLRFWGEGPANGSEFMQDATIDGQKLQDLIRQTRGGLRKISWGDENQWQSSKPYLYDKPRTFENLKADLITLAKRGYRFYDGIVDHFMKGSTWTAGDLAKLMLKPGNVQVALKKSAALLFPASLLYDYPLDDGLEQHKLCAAFSKNFKDQVSLEGTDCFKGDCPSRKKLDTVCPSGFWGYRHLVGLPLSVSESDSPSYIDWETAPQLTVAVSTNLDLYQQHQKALEMQFKKEWPALGWNYAEDRETAIQYMRDKTHQLLYFYCHGGLESNAPYLKIGPKTDDKFTRANLRAYGIRWQKTRPLVFINGCNTTAVEPEQALEFVSAFVQRANASGVIGTEITVFEPMARRFAEECLRRFIVDRQPNGEAVSIGEAVRGARLTLLKESNPLGLAYIPFVMPNLKMRQANGGN